MKLVAEGIYGCVEEYTHLYMCEWWYTGRCHKEISRVWTVTKCTPVSIMQKEKMTKGTRLER